MLLRSPDGALIAWEETGTTPQPPHVRWTGPAYALIGVNTFSAASSLAAALQDHGLATIVGQETGDLASAYGEYYQSKLPHTGLALNLKSFVRPSGVEDGRGVVPDIVVDAPAPADIEKDPAIDRILERIEPECRSGVTHDQGPSGFGGR